MSITLIGQAGVNGASEASPGPTVSYSSTGGNTLIVAGLVYTASTAIGGITAITDSAGNTWHLSTANANTPPSAAEGTSGNYICCFVAWALAASAVTSVTVKDGTGNSDFWRVALSEWSGIGSAGTGNAATGTSTAPGVTLSLPDSGDLAVGVANTAGGSLNSGPAGWTSFTSSGGAYCAYDLPGSAGTLTPAWVLGTSADWAAAGMVFRPTGITHTATANLTVVPAGADTKLAGTKPALTVRPAGANTKLAGTKPALTVRPAGVAFASATGPGHGGGGDYHHRRRFW